MESSAAISKSESESGSESVPSLGVLMGNGEATGTLPWMAEFGPAGVTLRTRGEKSVDEVEGRA